MGGDRIILDSSAVSAFAEQKGRLRVVLRKAIALGAAVFVPAPVISETLTGHAPRDAKVNQALKSCLVIPLGESLARAVGALRYRRPGSGVVDAMVVASGDAVAGSIIITADVADLRPLAAECGRTIIIGLR